MSQNLALALSVLLLAVGAILLIHLYQIRPWKKIKVLHMTIIFDTDDYKTYDSIMQTISNYDLINAEYDDGDTISRIVIWIPEDTYEPIYKSINAIQTAEVI